MIARGNVRSLLPLLLLAAAELTTSCGNTPHQVQAVDPGVRSGPPGAGTPLKGLTAGRKRVLSGWPRQVRRNRGRDGRRKQRAWASLQLKPVLVLPLAAGCRRIKPCAEPLDRESPLSMGQRTQCHGSSRKMVPSVKRALSGIRTEPTMAKCTTSSSSPAAVTPRVATSPNPTFCLPETLLSGQGGNPNIIFRIPTPVFGAGLIEAIPDSAILANMKANASVKAGLGHLRSPQRAPERQCEPQRKRRDNYPLRMEGAKQVPSHVRGRGIQRRDGDHEPTLPSRARRDSWLSLQRHARGHTQLHARPPRPLPTPIQPSSQTSRRLPTSCGCWPRPLRRPTRRPP